MLDEECLRPGNVSDLTFLDKLDHFCCSHRHYQSRGCAKSRSDRTLPHDAFRLIHYAGAVSIRRWGLWVLLATFQACAHTHRERERGRG